MGGAIPLVDYDPALAPMWVGLPVVQVHNWSLVTPVGLATLSAKLHTMTFDWAKLYAPYWFAAIWKALRLGGSHGSAAADSAEAVRLRDTDTRLMCEERDRGGSGACAFSLHVPV